MFKKLAQQLKKDIIKPQYKNVTLPFGEVFFTSKNVDIKKLSEKALELYEVDIHLKFQSVFYPL